MSVYGLIAHLSVLAIFSGAGIVPAAETNLTITEIKKLVTDANRLSGAFTELSNVAQTITDMESGKWHIADLPPVYKVAVDYDQPVSNAIAESGCEIPQGYVTAQNVESVISMKGKTNILISLYQLNGPTTREKMWGNMDKESLRPANLLELLAFAKQFPKQEKGFGVVTLGARGLKAPFRDWLVMVSDGGLTGKKEVGMTQFFLQPLQWQWFAVVRK